MKQKVNPHLIAHSAGIIGLVLLALFCELHPHTFSDAFSKILMTGIGGVTAHAVVDAWRSYSTSGPPPADPAVSRLLDMAESLAMKYAASLLESSGQAPGRPPPAPSEATGWTTSEERGAPPKPGGTL